MRQTFFSEEEFETQNTSDEIEMDIDQTEDHNPMVMIPDTEPKIEIEESESSMEIDDVSQNPHNLSECTGDLNLDNLDLKLAWLAKN